MDKGERKARLRSMRNQPMRLRNYAGRLRSDEFDTIDRSIFEIHYECTLEERHAKLSYVEWMLSKLR